MLCNVDWQSKKAINHLIASNCAQHLIVGTGQQVVFNERQRGGFSANERQKGLLLGFSNFILINSIKSWHSKIIKKSPSLMTFSGYVILNQLLAHFYVPHTHII
jgi:hypothetical protein